MNQGADRGGAFHGVRELHKAGTERIFHTLHKKQANHVSRNFAIRKDTVHSGILLKVEAPKVTKMSIMPNKNPKSPIR
jgi:hypothetical protein